MFNYFRISSLLSRGRNYTAEDDLDIDLGYIYGEQKKRMTMVINGQVVV